MSSEQPEHFDETIVGQRFVVAFHERVQQALRLEVGDVLWIYPTQDDEVILIKKAPQAIQKLSKSKSR